MALRWYIVHVYSGFENKVKASLEERIAASAHPEKFGEVLVPTEEVVELVKGKRRTSARSSTRVIYWCVSTSMMRPGTL